MKYSIIINPNSENSQACSHALNFIDALIIKKQTIISVFFYGYAVKMAFINDKSWENVAKNNIKLIACSNIAETMASANQQLSSGFILQGLGQWMDAVLEADKRIEFT